MGYIALVITIFTVIISIPIIKYTRTELSSINNTHKLIPYVNRFFKFVFITSLMIILIISYLEYHVDSSFHYNQGIKFFTGDGYTPNLDISVIAFEKAANNGNRKACYLLGNIYNSKKEAYNTIFWWKRGMEYGDKDSAKRLGEFYDKNIFSQLTDTERFKSAYISYSVASCLGDTSVVKRLEELQKKIPRSVYIESHEYCIKIKKGLKK